MKLRSGIYGSVSLIIDLYESGSTWSDCHASEEIWDSSHVFLVQFHGGQESKHLELLKLFFLNCSYL